MFLRGLAQRHTCCRCVFLDFSHGERLPLPRIGMLTRRRATTGQYKAEEYQSNTNSYSENNQLALLITVDETFDNDHRVVNQKGSNKGRFTFTAGDAGEHRICFWASHQSNSGWFSSHPNGVRLHLDLAIGETTKIESRDKEKLADIEQRVRDLSGRLQDIRREQVFQRVRRDWGITGVG
jgi:hypothetical protein